MQVEIMKKPIRCQSIWQVVRGQAKALLNDTEPPEQSIKPNTRSDQFQQNHSEQPKEF